MPEFEFRLPSPSKADHDVTDEQGMVEGPVRSPQGEDHTTAEGELEGELRDDLPDPQDEDHKP